MSEYKTSSEVHKEPLPAYENGVYLWVIVGCSVGAVALLTLLITLLVYARRRRAKKRRSADLLSPSYLPGPELFCPQAMISSFSSSASEEGSTETGRGSMEKRAGRNFRRPLGPSTSLDPPSLLRLTNPECVQPRPQLTRWHTVASPQTTPVAANLMERRDEDDEDANSPPCLHGRLWFSLQHNTETGHLLVTIVKARHLPGRGLSQCARDPFVKAFLLPDEESSRQTCIRKRTLAPNFHETLHFAVEESCVSERTLKLSVYDVDKKKVRHSLGHVLCPLKGQPLIGEVIWRDLELAPQPQMSLGELELALSCNPYNNRIKATISRVRGLQDLQPEDQVCQVQVDLYHGRKVIKCKRTGSQSLTSPPPDVIAFDESFSFAVSGRFFDACSLAFTLLVGDRQHGRLVVGPFMYARGEPLKHWQDMLSNARNPVVRWHALETPK